MKRSTTDIAAPRTARKQIAYAFVLDALAEAEPTTRAMFGSTGVYLGDSVVFILRKKGDSDDGVWVAYEHEREGDALSALPNLTSIKVLPNVRGWRKLAAKSSTFEDDVLEACRLAMTPDGPLGKIPVRRKAKLARSAIARSPAPRKKRAKRRG